MSSKVEMCSYFLGYSITQKTMLSKFFSASSHFFKLGSNHPSFKYGIFDATCLLCRKFIPLKATAFFSSVFLLFSCTLELPFMMGAHWHLLPEAETTLKGLHAHHPILFCKFRPLCLCRILSRQWKHSSGGHSQPPNYASDLKCNRSPSPTEYKGYLVRQS